ncbi:lysosomal acid phosphatase-like isoform X1 [Tachysurus vachellii]|uniref:lysosomal acid phosphatase-like isoform X1 n=1 Tax=Tachysurus vachellii TaxID=175792 RepID=UPI00296B1F74|nr:lysosomal acid phosphatase-like isoform X1 [Tachysurus vachellii]
MGSCIFSILFFVFGYLTVECKVKLVTVLYRHGDRSPVEAFPTDPYQESAWPQGFGQLSQEGMQQQFELGQFLRKRYTGFLSENYMRSEIVVRSTDHDRTLMSAASNLAGLYPPNGSQVFHPGLAWQPIPIHTVPQHEDALLSFPIPNCPSYQVLMNETKTTEIYLNMTKTYKDFLEMVRNKTGLNTTSIEMIWSIYDTLYCERKHGLRPPAWVTPDVMKTLELLKNFSYQILFGVYKREKKCRLQGGVLLGQVIKNLYAATCLNLNQQLKMIMYSAHDTTIVALQEALNVYNGLQPPYASCHIIELHQDQNGSYSVAMFYRNDSTATEPYSLTLPGCAKLCPLKYFIRLTKSVIPSHWRKECVVKSCQAQDRVGRFLTTIHFPSINTLRYTDYPFQDRDHDSRCFYLKSFCRPIRCDRKINNPFWPSNTLPYWC